MGSSAKAVTQPSYSSQIQSNLMAQQNLIPQLLGAEQQFAPQQTALSGQLINQGFGQGVQSIGQYAPQLQNLATQGQLQAIQGNPLYNSLYNTAMGQVQAGGQLSSDQQIAANQAGLQGLAQAGRGNSNQAIFNQILGRTQYTNQNLAQHLANASTAMAGLPQQGAGYTAATSGLMPASVASANTLSNFNLNPESPYAANIQDSNQSAQQSANFANANMQNGLLGGILGATGAILGGPIGGSLMGVSGGMSAAQMAQAQMANLPDIQI